ncbi:MAG: TetM/TetW/TetO/TetS family tetracycline resistance ribosomal protection protein [Clostridiales bacterium]|nr:TetM/TetW/TetO/TetS family tetracycline resistance ribosomal protection protein [Clostridiales bacterium]
MGTGTKKEHLCAGLLAHVDAGKTTLSEALLYTAGAISTLGRVDHGDAHLDNHQLERARGITIFSKQATLETERLSITLLDTPGHVDFSTEMERTLQVLDYAILVISATDGVQAHTETLWRLLRQRQIPTFLFVTKMDLPNPGRQALMAQLCRQLDERCVDFTTQDEAWAETVALGEEALLDRYLETGTLSPRDVSGLIRLGKLFPCYFGAPLHLDGVEAFLTGLETFAEPPRYPEAFSARVFKIARDPQGGRLTFVKITGGTLSVRTPLRYAPADGEDEIEEKITQLRRYSGAKFQPVESVSAGQVCALLGLTATYPGQGLGAAAPAPPPLLEPVVTYRLVLPPDCQAQVMLPKLRQLEEEDPQLHITWDEHSRQIHARLMGQVQIEVLKSLIAERFDVQVQVDAGRILYKETIAAPVEGVGHYEPLRHYAEVHLLLEPLPQGSGLVFDSQCSEDLLDRNWQRLILTHLAERSHRGVLTGAPITDMKITLMSGRAHLKHTEGGDFRQATYRAVRQGLMQAESILLEPWYAFQLTLPAEQLGRAISDLQTMGGTFSSPDNDGVWATLSGTAPVSAMKDYPLEVASYTRGRGRFSCSLHGYAPCHDQKQVVQAAAYDPEADLEHTPDSVFCAHGGGFSVKWRDVPDYMHLESCLAVPRTDPPTVPRVYSKNLDIDEKELEAIFERTFGPQRRREYQFLGQGSSAAPKRTIAPPKPQCLIVDGYNMIFSWDILKELARDSLDTARQRLMDILSNYCGYKSCRLVLVFDGYKVKGNAGSTFDYHHIQVVYTKQDETGDLFIERLLQDIGKNYAVRVATSDSLIQLSALRAGVLRLSAKELWLEVEQVGRQIDQAIQELNQKGRISSRP